MMTVACAKRVYPAVERRRDVTTSTIGTDLEITIYRVAGIALIVMLVRRLFFAKG